MNYTEPVIEREQGSPPTRHRFGTIHYTRPRLVTALCRRSSRERSRPIERSAGEHLRARR